MRNHVKKKALTEVRMVEKNGLLVPEQFADEAGLGCDKCDQAEMVPMSLGMKVMQEHTSDFLNRHGEHGTIHTLEKHDGRLFVTGELRKKGEDKPLVTLT